VMCHVFLVQWLALDKEAKKLSVETTPNQVKYYPYWFVACMMV
jgi:hypothetical protein